MRRTGYTSSPRSGTVTPWTEAGPAWAIWIRNLRYQVQYLAVELQHGPDPRVWQRLLGRAIDLTVYPVLIHLDERAPVTRVYGRPVPYRDQAPDLEDQVAGHSQQDQEQQQDDHDIGHGQSP